jgi:hypothetical protein
MKRDPSKWKSWDDIPKTVLIDWAVEMFEPHEGFVRGTYPHKGIPRREFVEAFEDRNVHWSDLTKEELSDKISKELGLYLGSETAYQLASIMLIERQTDQKSSFKKLFNRVKSKAKLAEVI